MLRVTFLNSCSILYLFKIVISKDDTDDFLFIARDHHTQYDIWQAQNLPDSLNTDTQYFYSRVKRESPPLRTEDCVCGKDEICKTHPTGVCNCPKGSGIWTDECDAHCDCTTAEVCAFRGPQKICSCLPQKAKLDGVCVDCDCGENSECEFVNGEKTCTCKDGYEMHNGRCEECSCDKPNERCEIIKNWQTKSLEKICICKKKFLKVNNSCTECWCGESHACDIADGKKICFCQRGFAEYNGMCEQCVCGGRYRSCKFQNGQKVCDCLEGFSDNNGICQVCSCGANSKPCKFQNGKIECECLEGFSDNNGICQKCFCGKNSTCWFENGEKLCMCPYDQIQRNGFCSAMCLDDTCDKGTCEISNHGFYCNCEAGYSGHLCDEETILSQGAIYLISVLSAITLFWVILLLIFIIRKQNRYRHYRKQKLDTRMNILNEDQL